MKKFLVLSFCVLLVSQVLTVEGQPGGFISIDCGAATGYTDPTTKIVWVPDTNYTNGGSVANVSRSVTKSVPLQTLRYFPGTQPKYCFNIGPVNVSSRYLVRATFLYGNYDGANNFPSFSISVDASSWATVTIANATSPSFNEFIAVASSTSFVVCLLKGATGSPFISSLELRPLSGGLYALDYLATNFLTQVARINFGAPSADSVRFPDDPVDRIWISDQVWGLEGEAPQTVSVSTNNSVDVAVVQDVPPVKVMQTAVVGNSGTLSYRLEFPQNFPANCYAKVYFAEIENLASGAIREFTFTSNINSTMFNGQSLDLARDIGPYTAVEPGFTNATIPVYLDIYLVKTNASTLNPILNALEIYQILPVTAGTYSGDVQALSAFTQQLSGEESAGDPCLPVSWDFITCSSDSPPRVIELNLSGRHLTGNIPGAVGQLTSLLNLWLDNNNLTGNIPDLSQLTALQSIQLQNNQLSGPFPSSLGGLSNLADVFVQNNNLTGTVPSSLLNNKNLRLQASGNPYLCANITCAGSSKSGGVNIGAIVGGTIVGALVIISVLSTVIALLLWRRQKDRRKLQKDRLEGSRFPFQLSDSLDSGLKNEDDMPSPDSARHFHLAEVVMATENFSKLIGSGGFGPVYYGQYTDEGTRSREIAVKVLSTNSNQGVREFFNEVNLLSRIHHVNLVTLIGYCADIKERMLVYDYMHKGSLRDHLHGSLATNEPVDWLGRLNIVLDAAQGLEYLHKGCNPPIIHRDVKSSNILINSKGGGKVSDFGLSKLLTDDASAVSTTVRGTVGYLDPEYYVSQQLTTKSDVYSFGVVLLEIITGREPIFVSSRGTPDANLVNWARGLLQKGDIQGIVDPAMGSSVRVDSVWKLAELALRSVEPYGKYRPTMSEIVAEVAEIIQMETQDTLAGDSDSESFEGFSFAKTHSPSTSVVFDSSSNAPLHSGELDSEVPGPR